MKKIIKILEHTFYLTSPEYTIIDLGANIGKFREACFNILGRAHIKKYIGVEPNPSLYEKHLKPLEDNVTTFYNSAISTSDSKKVKFYLIDGNHECGNIIGKDNFLWGKRPNFIDVQAINFTDLIKDLDKIDYVKIDIEGGEYDLISSLTEFSCRNISQMSIEFHDFVDPSLRKRTYGAINYLESLGFEMVYSQGLNYMHNTDYADCLFVNRK